MRSSLPSNLLCQLWQRRWLNHGHIADVLGANVTSRHPAPPTGVDFFGYVHHKVLSIRTDAHHSKD